MTMEETISYEGIDEAVLVLALYHNTVPLGMGRLHDKPSLTLEDVRKDIIDTTLALHGKPELWFDYYYGRPLKITLDTEHKTISSAWLYDRDAPDGAGACKAVIDRLRSAVSSRR